MITSTTERETEREQHIRICNFINHSLHLTFFVFLNVLHAAQTDHRHKWSAPRIRANISRWVCNTKGRRRRRKSVLNWYSQKVREQFERHLLFILYINTIKSALSLFGVSVCPRCVLVLELCTFTGHISFHSSLPASSELAIVQHCIQQRKGEERGVCLCMLGLEGAQKNGNKNKKKKERKKSIESDLCDNVWSRHLGQSGTSICHPPSRFFTEMKEIKS